MSHKILIFLFVIIFLTSGCNAQSKSLDDEANINSGIDSIELNQQAVEKLILLCKTWGFLKYYHPEVASGNYNWDEELFHIIPDILISKDNKEVNNRLISWINSFGDVEICHDTSIDSSKIKMEPDFTWINDLQIGGNLRDKLNQVRHANRNNKNYYVVFGESPSPIFQNEEAYSKIKLPDAGFRLLALFRYWNIIQYYYPYRYLIDDWEKVLCDFIPTFIKASNALDYHLSILSLITKINDTHAKFTSRLVEEEFLGRYVIPVEVSFIENKPVVTGFLNQSENAKRLQIGDIIKKINNENIDNRIQKILPYVSASNDVSKFRDVAWDLLRSDDLEMTVEVLRDGILQEVNIEGVVREKLDMYQRIYNHQPCITYIKNDVAYLNPWGYKTENTKKIISEIKKTKGIIIDLRYPFFEDSQELLNYLLPKPTIGVKMTTGSIKYPGLFIYWKDTELGEVSEYPYLGRVVVLINEFSQSSMEFIAMIVKCMANSVVIGSKTAGADGVVSRFTLPGELQMAITGSGVYYPDGRETQRIGIIPDIEVHPTIEGIKQGKDELIEKAIEVIECEHSLVK